MDDEKFMRLAIEKAREGIGNGQTPFGSCIIKDGKVISCESNSVWKARDITAHAEMNAIREACKKLETIDLSSCVIYSTCEPCPMCFSACYWARISKIIFGMRIEDALRFGFNEMLISNTKMKLLTESEVEIEGGFMKNECMAVFKEWSKRKDKRNY